MTTAPSAQDVAEKMGLPRDAPLAAIQAYVQSTTGGDKKSQSMARERKHQAEQAIIQYMDTRNKPYLTVQDRYLVVKEKSNKEGWTDALIAECYINYHKNKLSNVNAEAVQFLQFCKSKQSTGATVRTLVLQKKRPMHAMFAQLAQSGRI